MQRYIPVFIYRNDIDGYDCTLNGVTSPERSANKIFVIPCDKGYMNDDDLKMRGDLYVVLDIERRNIGGNEYVNLRPRCAGSRWTMFGGNFAWSSDSRFREISERPLPIHDRIE